MSASGSLVRGFSGLLARLDADGVPYARVPDLPQVVLGEPDGAAIRLTWMSGPGRFQARFRLNAQVPPDRVADVALAIARINAGLHLPGFELDLQRGEIAFRVVHLLERDRLPYALLQDILTTTVQTAQQHVAELLGAAQPPAAPAEAAGAGADEDEDAPWWGED